MSQPLPESSAPHSETAAAAHAAEQVCSKLEPSEAEPAHAACAMWQMPGTGCTPLLACGLTLPCEIDGSS